MKEKDLQIFTLITFIIKMKKEEWCCKGIQPLPVHILLVLIYPSLEDTLKFAMAIRRCQKVNILMTSRNIHFDLFK